MKALGLIPNTIEGEKKSSYNENKEFHVSCGSASGQQSEEKLLEVTRHCIILGISEESRKSGSRFSM